MKKTDFLNKYGTWAIVTGASDGIGKEFAIQLAEKGMNLVLVARRQSMLDDLKATLSKNNIEIDVIVTDLSSSEGCNQVIAHSLQRDVGLFVAAAGFGTSGQFINIPLEKELSMIDLNCRSVVELCHHFSRLFRDRKRGGIVLFGSLVAFQGVPRTANYAATKAFIQTFAEGLHYELRPYGVDVLAVAPGPIHSGFESRANMKMGMAGSSKLVAQASLKALGKCVTVRPGFLSKFLEFALTLPRSMRIRIMALVMKGMTKHLP